MMKAIQRLNEAKDLSLYKRMVDMFARAYESYSGFGGTYRKILDGGFRIIPKDKRAQEILNYVVGEGSGKNIQSLMNMRFAELPVDIRPNFRNGKKYETAYWCIDDKLNTKIFDLLSFPEVKGKGKWADESCKGVSLLELQKKEG